MLYATPYSRLAAYDLKNRTELWGAPATVTNIFNLRPGTLDDTSWLEPVGHIWTRSAQPWFRLPEGSLQYPEAPDMMELVKAWKSRQG